MEWLIEDIAKRGPATTPREAEERPVPEFGGAEGRSECAAAAK